MIEHHFRNYLSILRKVGIQVFLDMLFSRSLSVLQNNQTQRKHDRLKQKNKIFRKNVGFLSAKSKESVQTIPHKVQSNESNNITTNIFIQKNLYL